MEKIYDSQFEFLFKLLIKIASNSTVLHKHASALIHDDIILSSGYNKFTHNNVTTIHAEMDALQKFNAKKKNLKYTDIIVIRLNKKGSFINSRPCSFCIQRLQELGIRKVYYSNKLGNIICESINLMEKTHISTGDIFLNKKLK